MQPLSALDASFIYLESEHSPMHVGSVYVLDAADAPKGFGYAAFRTHISSRLRCSRIFRQRLVEVPLDLAHPCWINDPDFELDLHLPRRRLVAPGGREELMSMAADIFAQRLDRSRPLWEFNFIEGLDGVPGLARGSFALVAKVHHAAIDGISGAEIIGATLDATSRPEVIPGRDEWMPEEIPGTLSMVAGAYAQIGGKARELGRFLGQVAAGAARVRSARKATRIDPPPALFSAPETPNVNISSRRSFWALDFGFDRIRDIRRAVPGLTVNDVVLAICAGALRDWLEERGELPEQQMVAMAPISVRQAAQRGTMGNQVSAMLVGLATDVADPLQRLLAIHANARSSKVHSSALPAERIAGFIPSETAAAAVRLYTRMRLGGYHRPFFNLVITNVPGPPKPLYLAGARVSQHFGMAPVLDGMGLIIVAFSYGGRISFGLNACAKILPDPRRLADGFRRSLASLEDAVKDAGDTGLAAGPSEGLAEPAEDRRGTAGKLRGALQELEAVLNSMMEDRQA
jgi:WS/DGAT/MGAT family acyltransferase